MSFFYYFVLALFILVSFFLCVIILIQENKSLGLGASFGGDSGTSLFGTSTATIVKKITAWLAFFFMVGCVVLSLWTAALGRSAKKVESLYTQQEIVP